MICIRNGLVFDAVHEMPEKKDILIHEGKIVEIGKELTVQKNVRL